MARLYNVNHRRNGFRRGGLSVLEFIGCVISVVGGMWVGAIYLGIDVEATLYNALYDAKVLESIPEDLRPQIPEGHPSQLSEEQFAALLQTELVALRHEISALRETTDRKTTSAASDPASPEANRPTARTTLAYWNRLRNIVNDEADLQHRAQAALDEQNADNTFAIRARVSEFAAKAVEAIPQAQVDGELLQFGQQLGEWYLRNGSLYHRAAQLWSDRNAQQSAAQLTRGWETSERQLHNEAELLSNRAASVQASLARRYDGHFPEFGD